MTTTTTAHVPEPQQGFRPREYAHTVLRTTQPKALIDWYGKVLGLQVVLDHPMIKFLTWDDSQDRLAVIPVQDAVAPPPNATGLDHTAFTVASLKELTDQYRALKAQGILPLRCMNHGVATSMYYLDPDGNMIELTVEAFASTAQTNAWLATGAFDANPAGALIDPEELCARVDSGEPEEQILTPHPQHAELLHEFVEAVRKERRGSSR
ncbi:VOC family protein [Streptomyces sp. SID12501]|uniref:Biphenyl 2,3-dioxygenase n=1 Tax=Streptomyces sp. SID12501 TaxID=2706042 RepID=A0A6B3BLI5_9ACTN|nr:VOC family protein [Streptomyces sp. SID12501]NEC85079.1 biphenyl 2,3-dioxygenase [Streptomyces sp. SID12501]